MLQNVFTNIPAKKGFAAMTPERRREISSMGGKAAHAPGGHGRTWTSQTAREASLKRKKKA